VLDCRPDAGLDIGVTGGWQYTNNQFEVTSLRAMGWLFECFVLDLYQVGTVLFGMSWRANGRRSILLRKTTMQIVF
jgi:hypothetical protein